MRPAPLPVLLPALLALSLSACGSPPAGDSAETPAAATGEAPQLADARPTAFTQCQACHAVEPGKNGVGPTLAGVFGAKAGANPAFNYSSALKESGLTWDEATLDQWLAGPMAKVPGTRMVYAGQPDPAVRKELIDYIKTLK